MTGKASTIRALPEARQQDMLQEAVGDEMVVYDLQAKEVHCLGPLAALVFGLCDGETSPAAAAAVARDRLELDVEAEHVLEVVAQLHERRLLSSPLVVQSSLSRRDFVRRSAVAAGAAAFAAPLITSIAAPTAAMAINGIPSGCTGCGQNKDCVSGHCCQTVAGKQCSQSCCVTNNNSCRLVNENCGGTGQPACVCRVTITGCGTIACPPGTSKCCV